MEFLINFVAYSTCAGILTYIIYEVVTWLDNSKF